MLGENGRLSYFFFCLARLRTWWREEKISHYNWRRETGWWEDKERKAGVTARNNYLRKFGIFP